MERVLQLQQKAQKELNVAEHLLIVTFALVKDPKMLLGVTEKIFLSCNYAMSAVVYFERRFKRIPPFHDIFDSRYNAFKHRVAPRYKVPMEYMYFFEKLKDIVVKHKKSSMEFPRSGKFIICSDKYDIESLSYKQVHGFLQSAKTFTNSMAKITDKYKNIFKMKGHLKKKFF